MKQSVVAFGIFVVTALLYINILSFADEWKPRHDLVSHTGVMNLTEPPPPSEVFFSGPASPQDHPGWLEGLKAWRRDRRTLLRYDGAQFDRLDLQWTQHIFSQVQLLIWDRSLYDPEKGEYTVDRFLSETESRIGPIDAVLIWHVYPNLGIDDRNQFDLLRDLPGGVAGVRGMVEQFHSRGVKVFFPFLAWDTGTRNEGTAPATVLAQLLKDIDADGINFDTLESVPPGFREASDAIGHPLALEAPFHPRDALLAWTNISWNDWVTWEGKQYPFVPMVSKNKWMEPRHTVNITDRYTRDKTDSLQHAFFNGQGYATLENLWGFWYGNTPRDAETLLRFTRIERTMADYLISPGWEPHAPVLQSGVFASRFPLASGTPAKTGQSPVTTQSVLWTIVNRNEYDVSGAELEGPNEPVMHYYDLWHGKELTPSAERSTANGKYTLSFNLEGLGSGAILATKEKLDDSLRNLLSYMAERPKSPLASYSREWKAVPQTVVEIAASEPAQSERGGLARIPEGDYDFRVSGIEIEGGNDPGVDVQYPWEDSARRFHRHRMHLRSFYIDRTPVTNAEFKKFLDATHYHPQDDHNFLRPWIGGQNGQKTNYPEGWGNKPVTWVSMEDARAYAAWARKRLPHEWEWQYAAQSTDGRAYPWGSDWKSQNVPAADPGPAMQPLD